MITDSFFYGSRRIDFYLEFTNRVTLGISVNSDMEVIVHAPADSSMDKIKRKLFKKAPWIIKQQSYFLSFQPKTPERKFISGETHLYLGRQYILKIKKAKNESVKIIGRNIEVNTPDRHRAKELMTSWYLRNAKLKFDIIASPLIERFSKYNVHPNSIVIKPMPTRWGSCTPKGKIILNPELVKAPRPCIEYVIIHELCHLVHHDHTQKFIDLQTKEMPDWERWKMKLEKLLS
jgi:predicted metal-dependent hydrolase